MDKLPLLQEPEVFSVAEGYDHYSQKIINPSEEVSKIDAFQFVKWNYVIIDVPVFKYVVIDMIQVFVPLVIISVFSLFIFGIENGVAIGLTDYTILNWRIANVAATLFAYVALIPIIR